MPEPKLKGKLSLDDSAFARALRKSEDAAKGFGSKVRAELATLAAPLAALGPAVAAAFTGDAIWEGVKGIFEYGRELRETSDQTGIAVGKLFILQKQFAAAGLDAETASMSVARLQKFLYNASTTGAGNDKLGELRLSAYKLRQLAPEDQLHAIGSALARLQDPEERAALAMEFFGKSGAKLLAVFSDPHFGTAGSSALQAKAQMLERNAELYEEASIKLSRVGDIFRGFYSGLADRAVGPLIAILDRVEEVDLVGMGQRFGDYLIEGSLGVVSMLQGLKKADIVNTAKECAQWLVWGAEAMAGALHGFGEGIAGLTHLAAQSGGFLRGFVGAGMTLTEGSKEAAAAGGAGDAVGGKPAGTTADRVTSTGSAWVNPLDDTTETGLRAAARMGLDPDKATGHLENSGLGDNGGLSGRPSTGDAAEDARQRLAGIRDEVKWQNPLLKGAALNSAVNAEDKKQREADQVRQYRETHGGVHADKNAGKNPATEAGQAATTKKLEELITSIKTLVSS